MLGPRRVVTGPVALPNCEGPYDIEIENIVSAISVGTERWTYQGWRPDVAWPVVPGYLGVGRVTQVGSKVRNISSGQRVVYLTGRQPAGMGFGNWMCAHMARIVTSVDPAQYSQENDLPYCYPVPDGVPAEAAAFAGLAAVANLGLEMAQVAPGQKVAVWGLGMVGQFAVQWARSRGAIVFAADLSLVRRALARALPDSVRANIVPDGIEPGRQIEEARSFAPDGFDVIVDCTGNSAAVNSIVPLLRMNGAFVFQAWYPGLTQIDLHAFHLRMTRSFHPCGLRGRDVLLALDAMADGRLVVTPLITHRYKPFEAAGAYRALDRDDGTGLGQVFVWGPPDNPIIKNGPSH
jgi:2-desacetyl-2-hydroxyethyl bacteriochlorophyllide A dehydrogenase